MVIVFAIIFHFIFTPYIVGTLFFLYFLLHFLYIRRWSNMDVDKAIKRAYKNKNIVLTIGTIKDGICDWNVYGKNGELKPKELHTYEIASITKTITGALIGKAIQENKINMDDSIDKYINLPSHNVYPTIKDLLTHTSGYRSVYVERVMFSNLLRRHNLLYGVTKNIVINRIKKIGSVNRENSWNYSNFNFAILGIILENVYERKYFDLVNDFLVEQGMHNSYISTGYGDLDGYFEWTSDDAYLAAGAITSNIDDMFLYAKEQMNNNEIFQNTHKPLKHITTDVSYCANINSMGMGWRIDEKRNFIWHNGTTKNFKSYFGFCPITKTAVIILVNSSRGMNRFHIETNIGTKLLEQLQEKMTISHVRNGH